MTPAADERSAVQTPLLGASAGAWIGMLVQSLLHPEAPSCHTLAPHLDGRPSWGALLVSGTAWALMLIAMMLPLMGAPIRHLWDRSFARRRARAIVLFLVAYLGVWMAVGVVLVPAAALVHGSAIATFAAILLVVVWQQSPGKQMCLNRLHVHPALPAFGIAADAAVLRFSLVHAAWCVGTCAGLMFLPMLWPRFHFIGMMAASLWIWGEHLSPPEAPAWTLRAPRVALRLVLWRIRSLWTSPARIER